MITYQNYSRYRDERGLSDYKVAKLSKVSTSTFSDWRNDKHQPNKTNMKKIADALGVTVDDFYQFDPNEKPISDAFLNVIPRYVDYVLVFNDGMELVVERNEYHELKVAVDAFVKSWIAAKRQSRKKER